MSGVADLLRDALSGGSFVALPLALAGGVVTGLNPCCLPMYPAAAATCCANRCDDQRGRALPTATAFVVGLALATSLLGVVAALAGRTMSGLGGWAAYGVAAVPLLMGMHLLGWIRVPVPSGGVRHVRRGIAGAFLAGLLLSLVIAPCGTPVLASVLSYAAYEGSVPYGGLLLFVYGAGAGLPVLFVGTVAGGLAARLDANGWRAWVDRGTGALLLGVGFFLVWSAG